MSDELLNSRLAPQFWQTPSLTGPLAIAITQWWTQFLTLVGDDPVESADVLVRDPLLVFDKVYVFLTPTR